MKLDSRCLGLAAQCSAARRRMQQLSHFRLPQVATLAVLPAANTPKAGTTNGVTAGTNLRLVGFGATTPGGDMQRNLKQVHLNAPTSSRDRSCMTHTRPSWTSVTPAAEIVHVACVEVACLRSCLVHHANTRLCHLLYSGLSALRRLVAAGRLPPAQPGHLQQLRALQRLGRRCCAGEPSMPHSMLGPAGHCKPPPFLHCPFPGCVPVPVSVHRASLCKQLPSAMLLQTPDSYKWFPWTSTNVNNVAVRANSMICAGGAGYPVASCTG